MQEPPYVNIITLDEPVYGVRPHGALITPQLDAVAPSSMKLIGAAMTERTAERLIGETPAIHSSVDSPSTFD